MNSLVTKFKGNPTWFYALSICATWAGAGSLIVGADTVQQMGVVPFLLWGAGNALSCVFFGIFLRCTCGCGRLDAKRSS